MTVTSPDREYFKPVEVRVGDFATFEKAIKKFRKIVEKEGTVKRFIEREQGYKRPSEKRRDKIRRAKYFRKQERKRLGGRNAR